ncbi:unnamed protein product [Caenorhabditis angaria]|uniref:DUF38 domain-containing protein n=1 Tax=Caenorhabditis angaria TaxID=860376 RepID=A0A9P1N086_9PELO|nr:unnamed protein product [Caenorhabditis angaria]
MRFVPLILILIFIFISEVIATSSEFEEIRLGKYEPRISAQELLDRIFECIKKQMCYDILVECAWNLSYYDCEGNMLDSYTLVNYYLSKHPIYNVKPKILEFSMKEDGFDDYKVELVVRYFTKLWRINLRYKIFTLRRKVTILSWECLSKFVPKTPSYSNEYEAIDNYFTGFWEPTKTFKYQTCYGEQLSNLDDISLRIFRQNLQKSYKIINVISGLREKIGFFGYFFGRRDSFVQCEIIANSQKHYLEFDSEWTLAKGLEGDCLWVYEYDRERKQRINALGFNITRVNATFSSYS